MKKTALLIALVLLALTFPGSAALAELPPEKPTLKMLGFNAAFDPNADLNAREIEKTTGYQVEYFMLPAENANEKLNIELASGTNYDIIKLNSTQYFQLVGRGALMPLDDLLSKYGQDLLATVDETSWKACQYNGQTYALPMRKEYTQDIMHFIIYRKDILDELGLSRPQTLEDLYACLKTIKERKPDMIPLTGPIADKGSGSTEWVLSPTICSAFGIYTDWQDVNGELLPMLKNPGMKEQLTFMRKLYSEGLIDADWAINTSAVVQEKFASGKAVMAVCDRNIAMELTPVTKENNPAAVIDYVLPLIGPNGEQGGKSEERIIYYSCIPKTSKNAEHAMNFMNLKAKWDNFLYLTLGVEGVHFTRKENPNNPSGYDWLPIMPIFAEERTNSYWYLNTIDETNYPDMWLARVRKSPAMWEPFEKVAIASRDISKADPIGYMPPSAQMAKNNQVLVQMANDFYLKVLTGTQPVDSYEAFLSEWDAAGGAAVTEEVNAWYKEFYGK